MDYNNILDQVKKIHFIGIGGSGMCPMAEILLNKGYNLTGSDIYESDTLVRIKKLGIPVFSEHKKGNIKDSELVVYSAAIKKDNPEYIAALENNIPIIERAEMLGLITKKFDMPIAVSGTHGKTTTTAMITQILINAKKDPTSIIGGKFPFIGGNSCMGNSKYLVCEACEYVDSFLHLDPSVSVFLNLEADHLDYFKTLDNIVKSFNKFAHKTNEMIIINSDSENVLKSIKDVSIPVISFGKSENSMYKIKNIELTSDNKQKFSLFKNNNKFIDIILSVPGEHNVYNATAAAVVADYLGCDKEVIKESLLEFSGVHRRFEKLGCPNDISVFDDFAHHPTEIKATLLAAKSLGFNRIITVFQPHTYSRTYMFLNEFAEVLSISDKVVLSEILAVREKNTYNIYSKDLSEKIDDCVWFNTFEEISNYIKGIAKPGDLVLTMGGGNVYKCANMILEKLNK